MSVNALRKWAAFGTGAGIEAGARDLAVTLVKVRPGGVTVVGTHSLENYAERPAADIGIEYNAFLREHGSAHLAAAVLLPRREVIVRLLAMPGVTDKDLAQAVRFQIDGLHPYGEDEAMYDFVRVGSSSNVLVGITRREVIDRYVSLFAESGIKIAAFTFSAAVTYSALRLFGAEPAPGFLALDSGGDEMEVYGESEARPVFSATFDTPNPQLGARALSLALSELRLDAASTAATSIGTVLPPPVAHPEGFDVRSAPMSYAAALAAACPRLFLGPNLLPESLRIASSRAMYVLPATLAGLLILGAAGLPLYGSYLDRRYLNSLQEEMRRLDKTARRPMAIDREITIARQRTLLLDNFRRRTKADLDAVNELTHLLNPPGWLNALEITRDQVRLSGETESAAGLLGTLDKSPLFEGSDFALPLARSLGGETFSIRSRREGALP